MMLDFLILENKAVNNSNINNLNYQGFLYVF